MPPRCYLRLCRIPLLTASSVTHLSDSRPCNVLPSQLLKAALLFSLLSCFPSQFCLASMTSLIDDEHTPANHHHHPLAALPSHPFAPPSRLQRHFAFLLCGHHTECIVTAFASHILIIATQTDKIAAVLHAVSDAPLAAAHEPSFTVHTLLGARPAASLPSSSDSSSSLLSSLPWLYTLLARQLVSSIVAAGDAERALVLCCALKAECLQAAMAHTGASCDVAGMAVVRSLQQELLAHRVW